MSLHVTICFRFTSLSVDRGWLLYLIILSFRSESDSNSIITVLQAEVNFLGQLHHGNLVKLIGYCSEDDQRLLVYEFMPRGSLENHLFRSEWFLML